MQGPTPANKVTAVPSDRNHKGSDERLFLKMKCKQHCLNSPSS